MCQRPPHRSGSNAQSLWVAPGGDVPYRRYSATLSDITRDCAWLGVAIYD